MKTTSQLVLVLIQISLVIATNQVDDANPALSQEHTQVFYYVNPCWQIDKPIDPYGFSDRGNLARECERV